MKNRNWNWVPLLTAWGSSLGLLVGIAVGQTALGILFGLLAGQIAGLMMAWIKK